MPIKRKTKSKQSSGSISLNKVKQIYTGENNSNKDPNISICNNTFKLNNSNLIKNNLIQNNFINNSNKIYSNNPIDELGNKGSIINNSFDIKTKLILSGDLFSNQIIEIDKYGMKNGLRQKNDGFTIFGLKENNDIFLQNINIFDYNLDVEKIDESNNNKLKGKVFEIYVNKKMGNGVFLKMAGCCHSNKLLQNGDINIEKNQYLNSKLINLNNPNINEEEIQNKNDQKIITTKSKQSSGSISLNKVKQKNQKKKKAQKITKKSQKKEIQKKQLKIN